ncbi:MAG: alanine/glycine:cation symporter family protein [Ruminococcus sp.]
MLEKINGYIWNAGLLTLLLGTGILLTLHTRFFQIRGIGYIFKRIFGSLHKGNHGDGVSQWKICTAALSASMGTGNIVGVTAALSIGGAGAVFWMWCSAFFGMMLTYGENVLSLRFRTRDAHGYFCGGPMAYLRYGLGTKALAVLYACFCILASFGMGNMTQSSAAASALADAFSVPPVAVGILLAVLLAFAVLGGIRSVGTVTQFLLPFVAAGYMLLSLLVILLHADRIPAAFGEIFAGALGLRQLGGGAVGAAVSVGLRHGVFSNEAGLGSSALIHSSSSDNDRYLQGMWSIFEVFLDTMVCCTLTALAVLTADVPLQMGAQPVAAAFASVLGRYSYGVTALMIALFAVCTMLGWCCCGETALRSLSNRRSVILGYRICFCILAGLGAVGTLSSVWTLSDIANGLMAVPNLLGLLLLMKYIQTPPEWKEEICRKKRRKKKPCSPVILKCGKKC